MGQHPILTYCLRTARPQSFPPEAISILGSSSSSNWPAAIKPLMPAKCPQTRRGHKKPLRSNKGQVGSGLGLMQKVAQSGLSATPPHLQAVSKKFPASIWPLMHIIIAFGTSRLIVDWYHPWCSQLHPGPGDTWWEADGRLHLFNDAWLCLPGLAYWEAHLVGQGARLRTPSWS